MTKSELTEIKNTIKSVGQLIVTEIGGGGSLTSVTVTSTSVNASSSVAAGARSATFTTSADFVGTINGIARDIQVSYTFNPTTGCILPTINYTITGGSIILDVIT